MSRLHLAGGSALLLALAAGAQAARADSSDDAATTVGQVVVTATRSASPLASVPASVTVVTAQQIQNQPAEELDDVLRTVPGVDLLGYSADTQHPTSNSLGMRGLGGGAQGISRVLVMVDGVPVNDPFFGYVQWNRVPLEDIDRVEVVRGGGSPLWGDYAEGGVINVVTAAPNQNAPVLDAEGGSYGTYRGSAFGDYRLDADNVLEAFIEGNGTSGYQAAPAYERAPFNVPTSVSAVNARVTDTATLAGDVTAHVTVGFHNNDQRLQTLLDTNSQRNIDVSGDITKHFTGDASLALTAFYGDSQFGTNNSTYFPDQFDLAATTQSLNEIHAVRAHDTGGSLVWTQGLSGLLTNYMVGVDWHYISGADHTQHFVAPDFSPTFFTTHGGGDQLFVAGFFQATLTPIPNLEIIGSGRLQYLANTHGFDGSVGGLGALADRKYTTFDPRVNVRYALPDGFALRGAYYESFRAPNIGDQFYTYAAGGFVMLPAPLLKPETLQGGEVGLDYVRSGLRAQFTFYRTTVDNYIVSEPTTNPIYSPNGWFVVQNQNIASVLAQGFEAEVDWDLGHGVSANLGYTWADSTVQRNPADPLSVGQQIIDVPRNSGAATLTYTAPHGWRVSIQAQGASRTAWASADHTDPGYPGAISADLYVIANLSGDYPLTTRLDVYARIQNLFDRRYIVTSYSAPSPQALGTPLEAFVGVRWRM